MQQGGWCIIGFLQWWVGNILMCFIMYCINHLGLYSQMKLVEWNGHLEVRLTKGEELDLLTSHILNVATTRFEPFEEINICYSSCWCRNPSSPEVAGVEAAEVAVGDLQNEVPSGTDGGWLRQDPPTVKLVFSQQEWSARNEFRSLEMRRRA